MLCKFKQYAFHYFTNLQCIILWRVGVSPAEVHVNMITEYVNNHAEILLMPRDHITFRAATCGRYDSGYDVTVKIDIPENPGFNSDLGVVLFALSNSNSSSNGVSMFRLTGGNYVTNSSCIFETFLIEIKTNKSG